MAELKDRDVLETILSSCQYLHVKLDRILGYIDGEEEEEDDEADS
jgi:hypothetical protein